jgi:NADH-quinone oxidoreductase subunit J
MMLNIKLAELNNNNFSYLPLAFILGVLFICELLFLSRFELNLLNLFHESALTFLADCTDFWLINYEFLEFLGSFSNIKVISHALYTNYLYSFLLSGIILLLAMIAAIVLTLQKKFTAKTQQIFKQVLRRSNESIKIADLKIS